MINLTLFKKVFIKNLFPNNFTKYLINLTVFIFSILLTIYKCVYVSVLCICISEIMYDVQSISVPLLKRHLWLA